MNIDGMIHGNNNHNYKSNIYNVLRNALNNKQSVEMVRFLNCKPNKKQSWHALQHLTSDHLKLITFSKYVEMDDNHNNNNIIELHSIENGDLLGCIDSKYLNLNKDMLITNDE